MTCSLAIAAFDRRADDDNSASLKDVAKALEMQLCGYAVPPEPPPHVCSINDTCDTGKGNFVSPKNVPSSNCTRVSGDDHLNSALYLSRVGACEPISSVNDDSPLQSPSNR
mmetsp:Transcript_16407/g.42329  ORF Transcript_16407/g.42329 Transcript_16407/m.42329 type:complete len:111 (-) Transcript_16407:441-773(-)